MNLAQSLANLDPSKHYGTNTSLMRAVRNTKLSLCVETYLTIAIDLTYYNSAARNTVRSEYQSVDIFAPKVATVINSCLFNEVDDVTNNCVYYGCTSRYLPDADGRITASGLVKYGHLEHLISVDHLKRQFEFFKTNSSLLTAFKFFNITLCMNPVRPAAEVTTNYINEAVMLPYFGEDHLWHWTDADETFSTPSSIMKPGEVDSSYLSRVHPVGSNTVGRWRIVQTLGVELRYNKIKPESTLDIVQKYLVRYMCSTMSFMGSGDGNKVAHGVNSVK